MIGVGTLTKPKWLNFRWPRSTGVRLLLSSKMSNRIGDEEPTSSLLDFLLASSHVPHGSTRRNASEICAAMREHFPFGTRWVLYPLCRIRFLAAFLNCDGTVSRDDVGRSLYHDSNL